MRDINAFHIASADDVLTGKTTDIYFERTLRILKKRGIDSRVVAEVRAKELPLNHPWAVFAGLEYVLSMFDRLRLNITLDALDEGTIFGAGDVVLSIAGRYADFCVYETPLLGFLCQASGIATAAARCRKAAGNRELLSFGARRMHPCLAPMIDRNACIGGADGISVVASAEMLGLGPSGTMPHALILLLGDTVTATRAFREVIGKKVKCVSLIDTLGDEKFEALRVARALGKELYGVRVDTPKSRRGDLRAILSEMRWELDLNGFKHVRIYVSGGLDEGQITSLNPWADGYGVGTRISNAPVVDFSLDIVEIEGSQIAKRGKEAGAKKLVRCPQCFSRRNAPLHVTLSRCACGGVMKNIHKRFISQGRAGVKIPSVTQIRAHTLRELRRVEL
ncbi:MAG: nicotinate phosphoribosyltransferase [Candidatus Aureabacteria bacterium]|nr:nicotinate phosphoribosyltransferase [Candidatus Auribacterota bacterium]